MSWTNIGIGILCSWAIKNSSLGRRLYNIFKKQLSKDFVYIHKIVSLPLCIFLRREPSSSVDVNQVFVLCRTNSTDMTTGEELYCKMDGRRVRYNRWEKGEYMFVAKSKKWMRCYRWKDGLGRCIDMVSTLIGARRVRTTIIDEDTRRRKQND